MKNLLAIAILLFSVAPLPASADSVILPADANFGKLRSEFGSRADFDDVCEDKILSRDMVVAMNSGKSDELLELTGQRLGKCPVDILAHLYRGSAFQKLGNMAEAGTHFRWANGLVQSILVTGDGKTPETAWVTISLAEEKAVLGYLRLRMVSQTLITTPYRDRVDAVGADGAKRVIYFFPEAHFARLARKLGVPNPVGNSSEIK